MASLSEMITYYEEKEAIPQVEKDILLTLRFMQKWEQEIRGSLADWKKARESAATQKLRGEFPDATVRITNPED